MKPVWGRAGTGGVAEPPSSSEEEVCTSRLRLRADEGAVGGRAQYGKAFRSGIHLAVAERILRPKSEAPHVQNEIYPIPNTVFFDIS